MRQRRTKKRSQLDKPQLTAIKARLEDMLVREGWKIWPENATQQQIDTALQAYIHEGRAEWYPPGYQELPVIREGKLKVKPEEEDKPFWKRLLRL